MSLAESPPAVRSHGGARDRRARLHAPRAADDRVAAPARQPPTPHPSSTSAVAARRLLAAAPRPAAAAGRRGHSRGHSRGLRSIRSAARRRGCTKRRARRLLPPPPPTPPRPPSPPPAPPCPYSVGRPARRSREPRRRRGAGGAPSRGRRRQPPREQRASAPLSATAAGRAGSCHDGVTVAPSSPPRTGSARAPVPAALALASRSAWCERRRRRRWPTLPLESTAAARSRRPRRSPAAARRASGVRPHYAAVAVADARRRRRHSRVPSLLWPPHPPSGVTRASAARAPCRYRCGVVVVAIVAIIAGGRCGGAARRCARHDPRDPQAVLRGGADICETNTFSGTSSSRRPTTAWSTSSTR